MTKRNPAIVTQLAVQPLPRLALLAFCFAYLLPGWLGREPWKSADIAAFGYMHAIAAGATDWLSPTLAGTAPEHPGLLPLWIGALSIQLWGWLFGAAIAARIPFALMLAATMAFTWYASFYLARRDAAQPVTLAFGGQATPNDYARAIADGCLLAFIACLGLAQLSHQTTLDLAQLCATSGLLCALAALPRKPWAAAGVVTATAALSASGAPSLALLFVGLGGAAVWRVLRQEHAEFQIARAEAERLQLAHLPVPPSSSGPWLGVCLGLSALAAVTLGHALEQFRMLLQIPQSAAQLRDLLRLWTWFAWPSALLAVWTLWRWRAHLAAPHLSLAIAFASVAITCSALTPNADRSMLLALPAISALAAFALPTVRRAMSAAIDWFTLLFFSGCAFVIWVVWFAMHTGIPTRPAANVMRLAPGFEPQFSLPMALIALAATLAWIALVHWRVGRHRHPMWKTLVLPASGAALCWLLLMTLWLPLLDFARSYAPLMRNVNATLTQPGCIYTAGLSRSQLAAFHWYTDRVIETQTSGACPYLVVDADAFSPEVEAIVSKSWRLQETLRRPTDDDQNLLVFVRARP